MKQFNSGVSFYTKGKLPVVNFPEYDVCCMRCRLYKKYENRCFWTNEVPPFPEKHIGNDCPLDFPPEGIPLEPMTDEYDPFKEVSV